VKHLSRGFVCRTALRRRCPTPPLSPSRRRRRSKTSIILWFPAPMGRRARRAAPLILSRMPTSWLHVVECFGKRGEGAGWAGAVCRVPNGFENCTPAPRTTSRHLRELFVLVRSFFVRGPDWFRFHSSSDSVLLLPRAWAREPNTAINHIEPDSPSPSQKVRRHTSYKPEGECLVIQRFFPLILV